MAMEMEDIQKAKEVCEKYAKIRATPYLRHVPEYKEEFFAKAEEGWPIAIDEVDRLLKELTELQLHIFNNCPEKPFGIIRGKCSCVWDKRSTKWDRHVLYCCTVCPIATKYEDEED